MADNIDIKDGNGSDIVVAAKDNSNIFVPRHAIVSEDNVYAMAVNGEGHIASHTEPASVHYSAALKDQSLTQTTGYVLIDLSDTANFPHNNSHHFHIKWLNVDWETANATNEWSLILAFITAIDGTSASYREFFRVNHLIKGDVAGHDFVSAQISPLSLETSDFIGVDVTGDTLFNTGDALDSPRGSGLVTPGVGDTIVKLAYSSGNVDFNMLIGYTGANASNEEG